MSHSIITLLAPDSPPGVILDHLDLTFPLDFKCGMKINPFLLTVAPLSQSDPSRNQWIKVLIHLKGRLKR